MTVAELIAKLSGVDQGLRVQVPLIYHDGGWDWTDLEWEEVWTSDHGCVYPPANCIMLAG